MLLNVVWLLAGLALIIKGAAWFVAAAVRIAEFLRMPRAVIGSTLVSLATTSPELVVSIMAGTRGESGLAPANAVASCICNIGLILGVTAALKPATPPHLYREEVRRRQHRHVRANEILPSGLPASLRR